MTHFLPLIKNLAQRLQEKHWHLVTAESCTGGLVASQLTELAGSSNWFERGFVTYSNVSKQELLGVPEQLLQQCGAVSLEVAAAMATGALQHSSGNIALSVTGIAGPGGGTAEKPVGTVCFAWANHQGQVLTLKEQFSGDRHTVRQAACQTALEGLLSFIKEIH